MKADLPPSVADRDDAALRTTCDFLAGLNAKNQAGPGGHGVNEYGLLGMGPSFP